MPVQSSLTFTTDHPAYRACRITRSRTAVITSTGQVAANVATAICACIRVFCEKANSVDWDASALVSPLMRRSSPAPNPLRGHVCPHILRVK